MHNLFVITLFVLALTATATININSVRTSLNFVETTLSVLESKAAQLLSTNNFGSESCRVAANHPQTCTVPACGDAFDSAQGFKCSQEFGNASLFCGGGDCTDGLVRSKSHTTVSLPPDADFQSSAIESFICKSQALVSDFIENAKFPQIGWQYVADYNGALRVYPGAPQPRGAGHCNTFDVRQRPWYVSALSGPKDVVIIYDKSGSMGTIDAGAKESRMTLVKKAVIQLLSTFTTDDFIGLVGFSSEAHPHNNTLRRARASFVETMQNEMRQVTDGGGTYMANGFNSAFDILSTSVAGDTPANSSKGTSSRCTKIVIFLTDGKASDERTTIESAISAGQAKLIASTGSAAHIFTYSMGPGADDTIPRSIACANDGIWARISAGINPLDQMAQYYRFLSSTATADTMRWSAPYNDSLGAGVMITAAKSIVDRSSSPPRIVGVVATDVLLSQLNVVSPDDVTVLEDELISRGSCPSRTISECNFQLLRQETGYQCPTKIHPSQCEPEVGYPPAVAVELTGARSVNDVLCTSLDPATRATPNTYLSTEDVTCCAMKPTPLVSKALDVTPVAHICEEPLVDMFYPPSIEECPLVNDCAAEFCSCAGAVTSNVSTHMVRCGPIKGVSPTASRCLLTKMCVKKYVSCIELIVHSKTAPTNFGGECVQWAQAVSLDIALGDELGEDGNMILGQTHKSCRHHTCSLMSSLGPEVVDACNVSSCETTCSTMTASYQQVPTPAPVPNPGTVLHTSGGGLCCAALPVVAAIILVTLASLL